MNSLGECEVNTGVSNTAGGNCSHSLPDLFPLTPASAPAVVPTLGFAWPQMQSREPFSAEPDLSHEAGFGLADLTHSTA